MLRNPLQRSFQIDCISTCYFLIDFTCSLWPSGAWGCGCCCALTSELQISAQRFQLSQSSKEACLPRRFRPRLVSGSSGERIPSWHRDANMFETHPISCISYCSCHCHLCQPFQIARWIGVYNCISKDTERWNQLLTHCLRQGALPTPPRGSVVQESHWPSAPHQRLLLTATHVALAIMNWRVPFAHLRSWSPASTTGGLPVFCSNASNFNFLALQTVMVLPAIDCSNRQTYQTCFNIWAGAPARLDTALISYGGLSQFHLHVLSQLNEAMEECIGSLVQPTHHGITWANERLVFGDVSGISLGMIRPSQKTTGFTWYPDAAKVSTLTLLADQTWPRVQGFHHVLQVMSRICDLPKVRESFIRDSYMMYSYIYIYSSHYGYCNIVWFPLTWHLRKHLQASHGLTRPHLAFCIHCIRLETSKMLCSCLGLHSNTSQQLGTSNQTFLTFGPDVRHNLLRHFPEALQGLGAFSGLKGPKMWKNIAPRPLPKEIGTLHTLP